MSGVGSTNAMKKGSANNPFLAYSEADMQGFLNSAYTGCIVKYAGPSTKTAVPRGNNLNLGDAQNLVVDLTKSFTDNQGSSKSRSWYITIESETGNKCIMDITINKQTGVIGTPTLISDTIKALIYSIYTPYSSIIGRNINDLDVKFLSVTGTDVDRDVVTNWPITYGKNGWQSDCFNDSGKITLWGYGEKVTAIQNQNDMDYWSAYPILYTEPYVANVLYKVVYSNGQYYFEEFYHISENITTATVEDVAPGKTFYDFTGTKQTGTGTKINPYIASTADEMATYLTSSYKGAFVKYIGETVSAGGTSASVPFGSSGGNFADVAGATGVYLNPDLDATAIKTALTNSGNADASVVYLPNADSETMFMLYIKNDNDVLIICKMDEATNTYVPFYAEQAGTYKNTYFSGGFENIPTDGNVAGFIPLVFYTPSEEIAAIFDLFVSKTSFTSSGGESYVKNAIYQVAEDGDTTRYAILPTLTNEATADDVAAGKEFINSNGQKVVGTKAAKPIYGVSGLYQSDPVLTRTDDAVGMSWTMNDNIISSDFDNVFPYNQMVRETIDGDVFVKIPAMYWRIGFDINYNITDIAVSEGEMPGSENKVFVHTDAFYYGAYGASVTDNVMHSKSGVERQYSTTIADFRTYAKARGTKYRQLDLYHMRVLDFLWLIEFATKNSDAVMQGYPISGKNCGATDSLTVPSGQLSNGGRMRWRYIEDFIGNGYEFFDGACGLGATQDESKYGQQVTDVTYTQFANGYCLSALKISGSYPLLAVPGGEVNNSNYDTYFCDYLYCLSGNFVYYHGRGEGGSLAGLFSWIYTYISNTSGNVGSRLLLIP